MEAEKAERQRQYDEEQRKNNDNFEAMKRMQERAHAKRIEDYGNENDIKFAPKFDAFRAEMLQKIEDEEEETHKISKIIEINDDNEIDKDLKENGENGDDKAECQISENDSCNLEEVSNEEDDHVEWSAFKSPENFNENQNIANEITQLESTETMINLDYELDEMKLYHRPIEQHVVEKELVDELFYKHDEPESTPLLGVNSGI